MLSSQWLHLSEFFWITNTHTYYCLTLVCRLLTDLPAVCRFIPFPSFLKITADIQGADPRSAEMSQVLLCFYPHTLNCLLIYVLTTRTHWCGLRNKVSNVFKHKWINYKDLLRPDRKSALAATLNCQTGNFISNSKHWELLCRINTFTGGSVGKCCWWQFDYFTWVRFSKQNFYWELSISQCGISTCKGSTPLSPDSKWTLIKLKEVNNQLLEVNYKETASCLPQVRAKLIRVRG